MIHWRIESKVGKPSNSMRGAPMRGQRRRTATAGAILFSLVILFADVSGAVLSVDADAPETPTHTAPILVDGLPPLMCGEELCERPTRMIDRGDRASEEPDMWWAPVQSIDEVVADPQVRAAGGLVEVPDGASTTTLPATPVDFSATPWETRHMAPEHGQHTDDVGQHMHAQNSRHRRPHRALGHDELAVAQAERLGPYYPAIGRYRGRHDDEDHGLQAGSH